MFSIPRGMLTTDTSRTNTIPAGWVSVNMTGPDPATHYGPITREVSWYRPQIVSYLEKYTPNSSKDHHTWKTFMHYKYAQMPSGAVNPGGVQLTADMIDSNAYLDVGVCSEPYVLAGYGFEGSGMLNFGLPVFYVPDSQSGFVPAPTDIDKLNIWALQSMLPTIKGQLSLLNSIFELKDVVSVKRSAGLLIQNIRNFTSKLGSVGARTLVRDLSRLSGDHYLQWSFNVAPLISDIHGIYRAISTYERRINDFLTRAGRLRTSHFTKILGEPQGTDQTEWSGGRTLPVVGYEGNAYHPYVLVQDRRTVVSDATVFHAQVQYNYNYTAFQREHAHVLALLDALGVNFNPAIIWNALPWSFVVDWLLGVSRWLDGLKVGNMEPQINILQYCWSVKRSRMIHMESKVVSYVYYSGYDTTTRYPVQYVSYPPVRETAYRREAGLPDRGWLETSGLSSKEFSLGAALVVTRRRHSKRKR